MYLSGKLDGIFERIAKSPSLNNFSSLAHKQHWQYRFGHQELLTVVKKMKYAN